MKRITLGAAIACLALGSTTAQSAPPAEEPAGMCLKTYLIDRTEVRDEQTIVFHMKGGKAWVNKLISRCPGLRFNGFAYDVRGTEEVCSNRQSIRVLKSGSVCMLGSFTPAEPKPDSDNPPPREY